MKKYIFLFSILFLAQACNPAMLSTPYDSTSTSPTPLLTPTPTDRPIVSTTDYSHTLQIGSQNLMVEVANTAATQAQGLSDRLSMDQNQGMLFEFSGAPQLVSFWMKDMHFPLDFIWIDNNKVVGVTPDAPQPPKCTTTEAECLGALTLYYPPSPINWVVEVNAGWAKQNKIAVGDTATLKN